MQRLKGARLILFALAWVFLVSLEGNSQTIEEQAITAPSPPDGQHFKPATELGRAFQVGQTSALEQAPNPLLVVRERLRALDSRFDCSVGLIGYGLSYSELTIYDNSQVQKVNWSVPPCNPAPVSEWQAPANSKVRTFMLPPGDLDQLQSFLDRPEVKGLTDFMNAGLALGDYEIEMRRPSGVQKISVLGLLPSHDELKRDPTILRVICTAKEIGGDERPLWCADLPQMKPDPLTGK